MTDVGVLRKHRNELLDAFDIVAGARERLWLDGGPSEEAKEARANLVRARDYIAKARLNLDIMLTEAERRV